jgi:hypothetical protein
VNFPRKTFFVGQLVASILFMNWNFQNNSILIKWRTSYISRNIFNVRKLYSGSGIIS